MAKKSAPAAPCGATGDNNTKINGGESGYRRRQRPAAYLGINIVTPLANERRFQERSLITAFAFSMLFNASAVRSIPMIFLPFRS